jgi:hypothetical protein
MKTMQLLLLILISNFAFAKQDKGEKIRHHYLGINIFQPIMVTSMRQFHNDDWILTQGTNYYRKYSSLAFGLDYNYILKSNYFFSLRPSFSYRRLEEGNKEDFYCSTCYELDSVHTKEKFNYSQNHYNIFLGFGYNEKFKKMEIKTSIEFGLIYYSKGINLTEMSHLSITNVPADTITMSQNIEYDMLISDGISIGIGGNISIQYNISKKARIGLSVANYLLYTRFKNKTVTNYTEDTFIERTFWGYPEDEKLNVSTKTEIKENFRQISFSRIVPQLTLGLNF